jgi:hypothetical protein
VARSPGNRKKFNSLIVSFSLASQKFKLQGAGKLRNINPVQAFVKPNSLEDGAFDVDAVQLLETLRLSTPVKSMYRIPMLDLQSKQHGISFMHAITGFVINSFHQVLLL